MMRQFWELLKLFQIQEMRSMVLSWISKYLESAIKSLSLVLALEDRAESVEFGKDASNRPYVHT